MSEKTTYYKKNRETILNRAKRYYNDNSEALKKEQEINKENYLKRKNI